MANARQTEDVNQSWFEQHKVETFKSLITVSMETFKYLALLNGGAAAGMIASIDKLRPYICAGNFRISLTSFAAGLVASSVAIVLSWIAQYRLHTENIRKQNGADPREWHQLFVGIALFATIASVGLFAYGALRAARHIQ